MVCLAAFAVADRRFDVGRLLKALWTSLMIYFAMFMLVLSVFLEFPRPYKLDLWRVNPMSLIVKPGFIMTSDIPLLVAMVLGILLAMPAQYRSEAAAD